MTKTGKQIYFGAAGMSDFTKHKDEKRSKDIYKDMRKMKIGVNLEKIQLDTGVGGYYYGINQQLKKVIKLLKKIFLT